MYKKLITFVFVIGFLLSCEGFSSIASMNYTGRVTGGGEALPNITVTNGYDVVVTDKHGNFLIRKRPGTRFVYISVPTGYKIDKFYHPVDRKKKSYDFALENHEASFAKGEKGKEAINFIHLGDTEAGKNNGWVEEIEAYAASSKAAFVIHTGDICYDYGMDFHSENVNTTTMGLPVYYCVGNHDLWKGRYGEQYFEERFGPAFYSFNAGGVHFVVLPMSHGDYRPSYTTPQISKWLEKDLATVRKDTPLVFFNHDIITMEEEFNYGRVRLNDYNFKAWAYGHYHINYYREHSKDGKKGPISWTIAPHKGGIDNSVNTFGAITITEKGDISINHRYFYFEEHIEIPSKGVAIVYDSTADVEKVEYIPKKNGVELAPIPMYLEGKMTWLAEGIDDIEHDAARVIAYFIGEEKRKEETQKTFESKLKHIANLGSQVYMSSPIYKKGNIYVASIDDEGGKTHAFYKIDPKKGVVGKFDKLKNSIKNSIVYYEGNICGSDAENNIYIIDADTMNEKHFIPAEKKYGGANVSGSYEKDGILYAGFGEGLKAVEIATGKVLWTNKAWHRGEGSVATHLVHEGILFAGSNWNALFAHDIKTGKVLWEQRDPDSKIRFQSGTPIIHKGKLYSFNNTKLNVLEPKTGKILNSFDLGLDVEVGATPVVYADKYLITGTAQKGLISVDMETGKKIWEYKTGNALIFTSPYTSYPFRGEHTIEGEEPQEDTRTVNGKPLIIKDKVWFGASDGYVHCIDANTGDEKSAVKYNIGSAILNSLVKGEGDNEDYIYCVDFSGNVWEIDTK